MPRDQLAASLPMGKVIKTFTYYKSAWWREKGFSGQMVSDVGALNRV